MPLQYSKTQGFSDRHIQYKAGPGVQFHPIPEEGVVEISTIYGGGAFSQVGQNLTDIADKTAAPFTFRHGVEDRTASFSYASGVLTVTYVTDWTIWYQGVGRVITESKTVALDSDRTFYFVYFDGDGTLTATTTPWSQDSITQVFIALVYRVSSSLAAIGDERHSDMMDRLTHAWAHETIGARYNTEDGGLTGSFGDTTFTITAGSIYDEDLQHTITEQTTCRRWYRYTGGASMTFVDNQTVLYSLNGTNIQYDSGGSLTDATNQWYVNHYVYATNDVTKPIYCLLGQAQYATIAAARDESPPGFANITDAEWKLLYRVTYRNTGSPPTYTETADFRASVGAPSNFVPTDHGSLTGLSDNDHPQYLLVTDIDDTPVDGETAAPISSNWAYDHAAATDAHHDPVTLGTNVNTNLLDLSSQEIELDTQVANEFFAGPEEAPADVTDDFNRSNSNDLGANWTESEQAAARISIASNRLNLGDDFNVGIAMYTGESFEANQSASLEFVSRSGGPCGGPAVRMSGTYGNFTGYVVYHDAVNLYLKKFVNQAVPTSGGGTTLSTQAYSMSATDVLKIAITGTAIVVTVNDVEKISTSDSDISSGSPGGVANGWQSIWDNFVATGVAAGSYPSFRAIVDADLPATLNPTIADITLTDLDASKVVVTDGDKLISSGTNTDTQIADAVTATQGSKDANKVFSGPASGAAAAPTFRALVQADLPAKTYFHVDKDGSAQTLSSGSFQKITWGNEVADTAGAFADNTFTAPVAGKYLFIAALYFLNMLDGKFAQIVIYKNDGAVFSGNAFSASTGSAVDECVQGIWILDLAAEDTVDIYGYHNNGVDKDVSGTASVTFFQGIYLSA